MILPDMPNLAEIAFYMHQLEEELEIQSRIIKARALDAGYFDEELARKTMAYLVGGEASEIEGINLMSIVMRTILRRIDIQGFAVEEANLQTWVNGVWAANGMDSKQTDVHRGAERDGEYFVIVDYDANAPRPWAEGEETGRPVFYLHERYTSAEAQWQEAVGSNEGCKAHYRNDDPNQPLDMVSKRWIETRWEDGETVTTQRMTLFIAAQAETPARIEKYIMDGDEWAAHRDEFVDESGSRQREEWPIWWTEDGSETGVSLPLPVIHFRNEELSPISQRLWGLQHGMDQAWSSLLSAVTLSAHQIFVAFGFWPTTDGKPPAEDGSNLLAIQARTIIGNGNVRPGDASFETIEPGEIQPIIEALDKIAIYCSFVAGLPINNFVISKSVASSATLRQGEADLIAHVHALMRLFDNAWGQVWEMARILEGKYGDQEFPAQTARPIWEPAETVNIEARTEEALAKKNTGIPWQIIAMTVWGYAPEEVAEMERLLAQATFSEGNEESLSLDDQAMELAANEA